jgi:hypothetical protein
MIADVRLVIEGRVCSCGGSVLRVHVADGRRELRCESCSARRGLLSDQSTNFILAVCRGFGLPEKPIVLRRTQQADSV